MKKVTVLLAVVFICFQVSAQQKPQPKTPPKPATAQPTLKNSLDSFSYALGVSIASFYKEQGVQNVNNTAMLKAINDVMKNTKLTISQEEANHVLNNYLNNIRSQQAAGNKRAGEAFLAQNKTKLGVVTTASGLQYLVIKQGTGPKPTASDTVRVHYHGTLVDGTVFDSSVERGESISFPVGGVIRGWVEALQLMPVGSKWRLFIPSELAYGDNSPGGSIKPGSTLIFDVELLGIGGN